MSSTRRSFHGFRSSFRDAICDVMPRVAREKFTVLASEGDMLTPGLEVQIFKRLAIDQDPTRIGDV